MSTPPCTRPTRSLCPCHLAAVPLFAALLALSLSLPAARGADEVPSRLVMNKVDQLDAETLQRLRARLKDAWFISAHAPADVASVRQRIVDFFEASYEEAELLVPYSLQRLVSEMYESGKVEEETYGEDGVRIRLRTDAETMGRLRARLAAPG